jgi:hypothetical protein
MHNTQLLCNNFAHDQTFDNSRPHTKKRKILQKEMTIQNVTLTEAGEFKNELLPFSLVQADSQDIHPRNTLHLAKRTTICSLRISKYD